jgi:hypothetical protein
MNTGAAPVQRSKRPNGPPAFRGSAGRLRGRSVRHATQVPGSKVRRRGPAQSSPARMLAHPAVGRRTASSESARTLQILPKFLEPERHSHLTISLSAKVGHRPFEARDVTEAADCQLAGGFRIHAACDELACSHLDVQRELLVDLLIDRDSPSHDRRERFMWRAGLWTRQPRTAATWRSRRAAGRGLRR